MVAYWERVLNGLALYFPEELHAVRPAAAGLFDLVAKAPFPALSAEAPEERRRNVPKLPEPDRLPTLRQHFEALHNGTRPLRVAIEKLQPLNPIRIIEGKG